MHLEFFLRKRGWPTVQVTEQAMYQSPISDKILLVENAAEAEICDVLQLIYGGELLIAIKDPDKTIDEYLRLFSLVYTSWDPLDRNRI